MFYLKKISYIFIVLLIFTLNGCTFESPKYISFSTKPNNHYYSDELENKILNNENFSMYIFDTNLYKEIEVPNEETSILENFLSSIVVDNFSNEKISTKELYRIKVVFNNNNYIIKVFNDSFISISPWDGNYSEDIISMKDLPLRYNLFDFCKHITNEPVSK
jgi:hypothetical protein